MSSERILLVDDEANIIQLSRLYLEREGFQVEAVGDGVSALQAVREKSPALMVLDLMLPQMDGLEVCRRLRAENNPVLILMVTARDDDVDKIVGLELGADDYLTKPFNPRELVARVKAILRRSERSQQEAAAEVIRIADLEIDPARREVRCGGQLIELRTQEFEVVGAGASFGLVLSREKAAGLGWGYDFYGQTRTVDVQLPVAGASCPYAGLRLKTVRDRLQLVG